MQDFDVHVHAIKCTSKNKLYVQFIKSRPHMAVKKVTEE
jgi:hypothetical protein